MVRALRSTALVTAIDWIIVGVVALAAVYGYRQGFVVGALSLVGFALGALLGARLAPALLDAGSRSPWAPLFGLAGALVVGGMLAAVLEALGSRLRGALRLPALGVVDGVLGAALLSCVALGVAWIVGAVALTSPVARGLRADIQRSAILRRLNAALPPSGPILNALARFDPLPAVNGPPPGLVERPERGVLGDPGVRAAREGVVRVLGEACGLGIEGSGWVAGPDLVVTNAHVVAGTADSVVVEPAGAGSRLDAQAVAFDPRNDVAVLRAPGLGRRALALAADPREGTAGAILGYPLNGPFDAEAARIGPTREVLGDDAYGRGPILRPMTTVRGRVRSGNSGGPVVGGGGRVLTTVFAAATGGGPAGGFGVPNRVVRSALRGIAPPGRAVDTGPCAN